MEESPRNSEKRLKKSRSLRLFFTVTIIVIASRLPFIDNLHSGLGDSTLLAGLGWSDTPAPSTAMNCASALLCSVAAGFFAMSVKTLGGRHHVLASLALANIPIVYINSVTSADFLWALPLTMASLYCILLPRPLIAGMLLGLAISSRITVAAMLVPLGLLFFWHGIGLKNARRALLFLAVASLIGILGFLPYYLKHGRSLFDYSPCHLPIQSMIKIFTIEAWGGLGTLAVAVAAVSLIWQKRKAYNEPSIPRSSSKMVIIASLASILLYTISFLETPMKATYVIPILPFVMLLFAGLLNSKLFVVFCGTLFLSPFCLTLVHSSERPQLLSEFSTAIRFRNSAIYIDFLQGPIIFDRIQRRAAAELSRFAVAEGESTLSRSEHHRMWVTAYYPVWSLGSSGTGENPMHPRDVNWKGITHVVHFGTGPQTTPPYWSPMVKNAQGYHDSLDLVHAGEHVHPIGSYNMPDSLRKYTRLNGVKLLLSCGGIWGDQGTAMGFITQDSVRTQTFVDAVLGFARRHGYDGGIEIDWESSITRPGMSRLVRIMRRGLSQWNPRGELILAVVNGFEDEYDLTLKDSVDQYNIMLYDMHGSPSLPGGTNGWSDVTGFDAPLYPPSPQFPTLRRWNSNYDGTLNGIANVTSPRRMIREGWPEGKLGMGIPFFGYVYAGRSAPDQPRNCVWPHYVSAIDRERALQSGGVRHWEDSAKVPWIGGTATRDIGWMVKSGQQFYITYDDTESVKLKVQWARKIGLGGVMIYELWSGWISNAPIGQRDRLLQAVLSAIDRSRP
jgi:GH18 family chitinase